MTASEQGFLRLELEVLLKRLKRNLDQVGAETLKTTYRKGYRGLLTEIQGKAETYIKEVVFEGMGGYFRKDEVSSLFRELSDVLNEADTKHQLSLALFKEPDMGKVEGLAQRIRERVLQIVLGYKAHVEGGRKTGSVFGIPSDNLAGSAKRGVSLPKKGGT